LFGCLDFTPLPVIFGCAGTQLLPAEYTLFRKARPFGFILFKRNCDNPDQTRRLIRELRHAAENENAPILIDQEGGRVARLKPPHWPAHPAARVFGMMYEKEPEWGMEAVQTHARAVAHELSDLGITVNCAPVADLLMPNASDAIGDRAYSRKPAVVAALARQQAEVFLANGVMPVIKHMPGHGRLPDDPHHESPVINASRAELEMDDFVPFQLLKDLPLGMNSHAIFTALDEAHPASLSPIINQDIIRGELGFDGLLLSDDICMNALKGTPDDIARRALDAGNDVVLHCNGELAEMELIAGGIGAMSDATCQRWQHALDMVKPASKEYSALEDLSRLDTLLGGFAFGDTGLKSA
jgi:beta-N-acetylhexosaminidase